MKKLLFLFFIFSTVYSHGQTAFHHIFTNNGTDKGYGLAQFNDSSYVVTGSTNSFVEGPSQAFILKLDKYGQYEWSKDFGGSESDLGIRIIPTSDGGVAVIGNTSSAFSGSNDIQIIKIGPNDSVPEPDEFIFDLVQVIDMDGVSIQLYPNPSADYFVIHGIDQGTDTLVDQNGRLILQQEKAEGNKIFNSNLDQGFNFVSIETESGSIVSTKLIVQH